MRYPDKPTTGAPGVLSQLEDDAWLAQMKFDGWRDQITTYRDGSVVHMSNTGRLLPVSPDFTERVNPLLMEAFGHDAIIDAEWMKRRNGFAEEKLWLFDLLQVGGNWIGGEPVYKRFHRLMTMFFRVEIRADAPAEVVPYSRDEYESFYAESREPKWADQGCEGIVLKWHDSKYIGSRRGCRDNPHWIKVKWREGADGKVVIA